MDKPRCRSTSSSPRIFIFIEQDEFLLTNEFYTVAEILMNIAEFFRICSFVRYYETIRFEHDKLKFNFTKETRANWKIQTIIGLIEDSIVSIES